MTLHNGKACGRLQGRGNKNMDLLFSPSPLGLGFAGTQGIFPVSAVGEMGGVRVKGLFQTETLPKRGIKTVESGKRFLVLPAPPGKPVGTDPDGRSEEH